MIESHKNHRIRRIGLLSLVALLLSLVGIGVGALLRERYLTQKVIERYSADGQWIDAPSGRLFYKLTQSDAKVAFVLESGLGGITADMKSMAQALDPYGKVLTYDRSGLGMSQTGLKHPSLEQMARDTRFLMDHVLPNIPVVYIGYSLGASYVLNFERQYPGRAAALVILDPAHQGTQPAQNRFAKLKYFLLESVDIDIGGQGRQKLKAYLGLLRSEFRSQWKQGLLQEPEQELMTSAFHEQVTAYELNYQFIKFIDPIDCRSPINKTPLMVVSTKVYETDRLRTQDHFDYCERLSQLADHGMHVHIDAFNHFSFKGSTQMHLFTQPLVEFLLKEQIMPPLQDLQTAMRR